jgi:hypothetical protein
LAKSEDASAYIEERQSQDAEEQGHEPETPKDERQSHIERALEEARERSRQAREQEHQLDQVLDQAEAEWQQQQALEQQTQQQEAQRLSYHEARGRCMERAEQLKRSNPQLHKTIADNLSLLESVLDADQNKALEHALVYYPEAVWRLGANMSDETIIGTFSDKLDALRQESPQRIWDEVVKGAAALQQEAYVQQRIYQDRIEGRRITKAPPPITPPRGSASVPKDIHRLAQKSDASDYIKQRRAQNARAERD